MSSACSQAVELPEIVAAIMEHLPDNRTLVAALQVSKLWAEEATTVLWQDYPPISALIQIEDAERLQYYANKVSYWNIAPDEDGPELYRKLQLLRFPRLRQLSVQSSYYPTSKACGQLSRHLPKLEELTLYLMESAGETIFDVCSLPSLLNLELDYCRCPYFNTSIHFPADGFLALAKRCSHLQQLAVYRYAKSFENDGIGDINDDTLQEFVSLLPQLTHLRLIINTNITHRALRILGEGCTMLQDCWLIGKSLQLGPLGSSGPVLFPKLKHLQLRGTREDLPATTVAEILHHHAPRVKNVWIENPRSTYAEIHERMQELARRDEAQSLVNNEH